MNRVLDLAENGVLYLGAHSELVRFAFARKRRKAGYVVSSIDISLPEQEHREFNPGAL